MGLGLGYAGFGEEAGDLGTGLVSLLTFEATVADGENCCAGVDFEAFCHLTSVLERAFVKEQATFRWTDYLKIVGSTVLEMRK